MTLMSFLSRRSSNTSSDLITDDSSTAATAVAVANSPSNDNTMSVEATAVAVAVVEAVAVSVPTESSTNVSKNGAGTTPTSELLLSSDIQYSVVHSDHQNILVNAKIEAPEEFEDGKRESLDLVCVLDISSSMNSASKLDLCKKTLDFVSSQLCANDRLSLVTFSNNVKTVQKLTAMDLEGKARFRENVKMIRAQGMTNLSGGLLRGVSEVMGPRETGKPNRIQSVLLLTDGQANIGIKDKETLVEILLQSSHTNPPEEDSTSLPKKRDDDVETASKTLPFSVFTFGFGTDHNVELLKAVSDCANGVYYFVDDLDKVANAFGDCLGGLLSIVAQNTVLEIVGSNGSTVGDVFTDYPNWRKANKSLVVELGDLYAEEQRNILSSINLSFPPTLFRDPHAKDDIPMEICRLKLSCTNLLTKKAEVQERSVCVSVRPSTVPMSEAERQENISIEIHYSRWETSQTMLEADKMSDNHHLKDKAVDLLDHRIQKLNELQVKSASRSQSSTATAPYARRELCLLAEMQADLVQCRETVRTTPHLNVHAKKGFMQNKVNKLGRERNNSFSHVEDEGTSDALDALGSRNLPAPPPGAPPPGLLGLLDRRSVLSSSGQQRKKEEGAKEEGASLSKKPPSVFETKSKMRSKACASKW